MPDDTRLVAALAVIQARGGIGERSLEQAIAHSDRFVDLIPAGQRSVVDLGSGGGLPALVIAWRRDDLTVTMVERRATRADLLRRAVISLGVSQRCSVLNDDVEAVCAAQSRAFDVVTARSFAELATTARFIDQLLNDAGTALVSEPPTDRTDHWAAALDAFPLLVDQGVYQGIRLLKRR